MRHPQFSLKTLLWLMACVACLCAGMAIQKRIDRNHLAEAYGIDLGEIVGINEELDTLLTEPEQEQGYIELPQQPESND